MDHLLIILLFVIIILVVSAPFILRDRHLNKGFRKIGPSVAKHSDGTIVQSNGRDSLQLINGDLIAEVTVERGKTTSTLYSKTLVVKKSGERINLSKEDEDLILGRIKASQNCLGEKCELEN